MEIGGGVRRGVQQERGKDHGGQGPPTAPGSRRRSSSRCRKRTSVVDVIVPERLHHRFTDLTFTIGRTDYKKAMQITEEGGEDVGRRRSGGRQDRQGFHRRHGDALPFRRGAEGVRDAGGGGDQHPSGSPLRDQISVLIEEKYTSWPCACSTRRSIGKPA